MLFLPILKNHRDWFTNICQHKFFFNDFTTFHLLFFRCKELNLIERCTRIQSREATQDELLSQHTYDSIRLLKETQEEKDPDKLEKLSSQYDSIFINNDTYNCALLAAGSSINLVDAICKGEIQNGMAIVR